MARDDARLLVVARGVARELEDLGREVLEHSREVHGRARADARGVLALLQVAVHTADGELQAGLLGAGDGLAALGLAATGRAFACLARHAGEYGRCSPRRALKWMLRKAQRQARGGRGVSAAPSARAANQFSAFGS